MMVGWWLWWGGWHGGPLPSTYVAHLPNDGLLLLAQVLLIVLREGLVHVLMHLQHLENQSDQLAVNQPVRSVHRPTNQSGQSTNQSDQSINQPIRLVHQSTNQISPSINQSDQSINQSN